MKISARNQIPGRVLAITPGAVNGNAGDSVTVLIKASDVLIGK